MLCALIMAGGIGSRFWPQSTEDMPKQFLKLLGEIICLLVISFSTLLFEEIIRIKLCGLNRKTVYALNKMAFDDLEQTDIKQDIEISFILK